MKLIELADRCEKATGPDRELDAQIWLASEPRTEGAVPDENCAGWVRRDGWAFGCAKAPDYTASLDAAMTLVPEGYDWVIGRTNGGLTIHAEVGGRGDEYMRFGSTPALALCAAALRARAA
jgi:hypothetical protein